MSLLLSSKRISPQCFQLQKTYYIWLQQQLRVSDNSPKSRRKTLASRDALKVFLFSTTKKEKHCNALELSRLKEGFCIYSFFVLGHVQGHFCNVLLQNNGNLKHNIAEMSQDEKLDTNSVLYLMLYDEFCHFLFNFWEKLKTPKSHLEIN